MRLKKIIVASLFLITGLFCFGQSGTTVIDSIMSNNIMRK